MNRKRDRVGKGLVSMGLSVLLVLGLVPAPSLAEEAGVVDDNGHMLVEPEANATLGLPGIDGPGSAAVLSDQEGEGMVPTSFEVLEDESQLNSLPAPSLDGFADEQAAATKDVAPAAEDEADSDAASNALEVTDASASKQEGAATIELDDDAAIEVQTDDAIQTVEAPAISVQASSSEGVITTWVDTFLSMPASTPYIKSVINQTWPSYAYQFKVPSSGKVSIEFASVPGAPDEGVGTNVTLGVYASSNLSVGSRLDETTLVTNARGGINSTFATHLTKGTYYLRLSVNKNSAQSAIDMGVYTIRPSFTSAKESFEESMGGSNNSKNAASGPLSLGKSYRGHLSANDDTDFYRFSLSSAGRVVFTYANPKIFYPSLLDTRDYNGTDGIHNAYGELFHGMHKVSDTKYYADLSAGTYYLKIKRASYGKFGTYKFKLAFTKAKVSFSEAQYGSHNAVSTAGAISMGKTYYGQVSASDYVNYYKFYVGANRTIGIVTSEKSSRLANCNFNICDAYGESYGGHRSVPTNGTTVTVPYAYSYYYVCVQTSQYLDTGSYAFRLHDGPVEEIRWAAVGGISNKYYTGKAIQPKPKVTYEGRTLKLGTDYKLSYKNNKAGGTATVTVKGINGFYGSQKTTFLIMRPSVTYQTWIQGKGWKQAARKNGDIAGLVGKGKYIRYFKARIVGDSPGGGIEYQVNTKYAGSGSGWSTDWRQYWVSDGAVGGNDQQRIETMKIGLYGAMAKYYNVYYRVHVQGLGWMGWAKNGAMAGTENMGRRIEAVQVVLVKKKGKAPANSFKGAKRDYKKAYVSR